MDRDVWSSHQWASARGRQVEIESGNPLVQALLFDEGGSDHVVAWVRSDDPDLTVHAFMGGKPIVLSNSPTIWAGDRIEVSDNAR